jgi:hypothetical protein
LRVLPGGNLQAADGADPASVVQSGDEVEVSIGSDRYRLKTRQVADAL